MNVINNYNNGPNQILPSTKLYTWELGDAVALKIPKVGKAIETIAPISVPGLLQRTASQYPDHPALAYKNAKGTWVKITYREYEEQVRICAKAFLQLGLERYHSVCVLGFNSPEWFISSLGAIYAGAISVGIYTTNSSSACLYCAEFSKANIIVVQNEKQLQKILEIKHQLPLLKAIIQYEEEPTSLGVYSWSKLMQIGKDQNNDKLEKVLKQIAVNECCMLVFTSGTIGQPKAAMISHDNITWNALAIAERTKLEKKKERIVSYLPLSHIAAQVVDIYMVMTVGATIYFADQNALKGTLVKTLQEVRPTLFLGVPRVWEKMYEKIVLIGSQSGPIKKTIANLAKKHSLDHNISKMNGEEHNSWGYLLAYWVVLKRIKQALGLDCCRIVTSGAAPLATYIKKYFLSIDIPIMDVFGMSETSGGHTLSIPSAFGLDGIGTTIPGMITKVIFEKEGDTTGELCLYGRHICMGYLNESEKTKETIDEEGWLHSGDIGHIDKNGFVYITGRIKELLITAGGENVPPVPIETTLKIELPTISNVILIGDQKKFLSILITLKTEMDSDMKPLDALTSETKAWLQELGCPAENLSEVFASGPDEKLLKAIQDGIDKTNLQATSNAQRIQKFAILPTDFSIVTGELGPTLKLKRNVVTSKYQEIIEKLYSRI